MDEEAQPGEQESKTADGTPKVRVADPVNAPPPQTTTEEHLNEVEGKMNSFERSTLRWTKATFGILFVTCLFISLQWGEMRSGGADTHDLADAAKKQADRTKDLADRMKDQADGTKVIADQAIVQAQAAKSAADTAKASLDSSVQSFREEARAYVAITTFAMSNPAICEFPPPNQQGPRICVDIHMVNSGKTPAVGPYTTRRITFGPNARKTVEDLDIAPYPQALGQLWGSGPQFDQFVTAVSDPVDVNTVQDLVGAKTQDTIIYVYGVVQYRDIFGTYHQTGYCGQRVLNSTAFMACEFGNWFDKRPHSSGHRKNPNQNPN